ncbi:hypothetical protein GE09DRAFT_277321 [Coniochaeta sp. 2T2.1]|nr:hypothetical protein GE09DRAFT_277321 [Coniochaeta sp. 2T2.1]
MARIKKTGGKKAGVRKPGKLSSHGEPSTRAKARGAAREPAKAPKKSVPGNHAKVRHMRDRRGNLHVWGEALPPGLVARPIVAQPKTKHRSYFEFVENTDKKKKLEFQVVNYTEPPPGYEFVPIGNPALTAACKELSREQEAMVFIVSAYSREEEVPGFDLGVALNRVGHHIRERIVEQARASLGELAEMPQQVQLDIPEPIPEDQEEINKQADAAIRDLFPRIPNGDRQTIIEHSFKKGALAPDGKPLVGLAAELTLSRRVQLAVISHIRHTHTRYDQLLRETTWVNARRAVEELCLDILVKWRGDEENGRDQMDEILREVVVISDSEDDYEEDDDEDDEDTDDEDTDMTTGESSDETDASTGERPSVVEHHASASARGLHLDNAAAAARLPAADELTEAERVRLVAKRAQRGFQRYQAVRDQAWQQAVSRQRPGPDELPSGSTAASMSRPQTQTLPRARETETYYQSYGADRSDGAGPSHYHPRQVSHGNAVYSSGTLHGSHLSHTPYAYSDTADRVTASHTQPPPYYYAKGEGRRNDHGGGNGYAPIVGSHSGFRSSPEVRTVISRPPPEELKDYLLPSVEPTSPLASQFSAQSLQDRRQDRPEHWQSRPALHSANAEQRYANSQMPYEGSIRVYPPSGNAGRAEPMLPAYKRPADVFDLTDSGFVRSGLRETALHHPGMVANPDYGQPHPVPLRGNDHIPMDVTYSRHQDARSTLATDHRPAQDGVPDATWRPAVRQNDGRPRYGDAALPVVVEDRGAWREPYRAPVPNDGSNARYSDASRPIMVEDERTWRDPHRPYPAPVGVAEAPERVLIRRQAPNEPMKYNDNQGLSRADPYARPPEDDSRMPLGFIPVSNRFPRPHAPQVRTEETRTYTETYPRGPPMDQPIPLEAGHGYDRRFVQDIPPARGAREGRVVGYEIVQDGRIGEGQVQYRERDPYRPQDPSTGTGYPSHAYGTTPAPRPYDRMV